MLKVAKVAQEKADGETRQRYTERVKNSLLIIIIIALFVPGHGCLRDSIKTNWSRVAGSNTISALCSVLTVWAQRKTHRFVRW